MSSLKARQAFADMISHIGRVYQIDRSGPGIAYFVYYRFNADLELETTYTGSPVGWRLASYKNCDDWSAFLSHVGEKLEICKGEPR